MITGLHSPVYTDEPEATREFFRDVRDDGYGLTVDVAVPGAGNIMLYEPCYEPPAFLEHRPTVRHWQYGGVADPRAIPMLPCSNIDEIEGFFVALGFDVAHRQLRPNPYLALNGHGFDLHYYGLDGHTPENSHSSCGIAVDDTGPIWGTFATGLREEYGRVPVSGFPRMTRPRPRKNADGLSGFSLVDPAGNWIRFMARSGRRNRPLSTPGWGKHFTMRSCWRTVWGTSPKQQSSSEEP